MRIVISGFKNSIGHNKDKSSIKSMQQYLIDCFSSFGVAPTKVQCDLEGKSILIDTTPSENKVFVSQQENIIKLNKGDKRIKEDGRDFLKSKFLTKQQFKYLKQTLLTGFKSIGIDCCIYLLGDKDLPTAGVLLVDTENNINNIDAINVIQKTFPINKETYERSKTLTEK
jgi:hypothetical protein